MAGADVAVTVKNNEKCGLTLDEEAEMKGQGRGSGQGRGQGAGAGSGGGMGAGGGGRGQGGSGMGTGGSCLCPKCGRHFSHHQGVPCLNERCEDCGVALIREGSAHHDEISKRRGEVSGKETEG